MINTAQLYNGELVNEFQKRQKIRTISRILSVVTFLIILSAVALVNISPFGSVTAYRSGLNNGLSVLGPGDRILGVQTGEGNFQKIVDDLVYFNTDMSIAYDQVKVRITFRNPAEDQEMYIGYKNQPQGWHYDLKQFDVPFLDNLSGWSISGTGPYLYQRIKQYASVEDFLQHPPPKSNIGVYNYDPEALKQFTTILSGYKPSSAETVIDTALRGKHTMYVYVKDEPFTMKITKQDLNWQENPDPLTIKIYKGNELVYKNTEEDDGITSASREIMPEKIITVENPGPGYPESGVYKVILDCDQDTVIKRISTNLHKIVFEGAVFPIVNSEIYPQMIKKTRQETYYTDSLSISALTYHPESTQSMKIGDNFLQLTEIKQSETSQTGGGLTAVTVPKSDVIMKGYLGYFAFSKDQFFRPSPLFIIPISEAKDIESVDYILTDYLPGVINGDWLVTEHTFDLQTPVIAAGKLNWVIESPHLKDNIQGIIIKSIETDMVKKPLVKGQIL